MTIFNYPHNEFIMLEFCDSRTGCKNSTSFISRSAKTIIPIMLLAMNKGWCLGLNSLQDLRPKQFFFFLTLKCLDVNNITKWVISTSICLSSFRRSYSKTQVNSWHIRLVFLTSLENRSSLAKNSAHLFFSAIRPNLWIVCLPGLSWFASPSRSRTMSLFSGIDEDL